MVVFQGIMMAVILFCMGMLFIGIGRLSNDESLENSGMSESLRREFLGEERVTTRGSVLYRLYERITNQRRR